MTGDLSDRVVVPLANEDDATDSLHAIEEWFDPAGTNLTFVHVIEKGGGAPDKAPLGAREEQAERIFDIVETHFDGTDFEVESTLRYGTSVTDEIVAAADAVDATVIAFAPRDHSLLSKLLSGNLTSVLVSNSRFPVVVLPSALEDND